MASVSLHQNGYKRRPGIMLVCPRLLDPTPESASKFARWTKMHFRDLLNMPKDPSLGKFTRSLRFVAPVSEPKYSHTDREGYSSYFYTNHVEDVGVVKTKAYYEVPRQFDLETTRELNEGEEAVGQEGMVFHIVSADFAMFEEVGSAIPESCKDIGSYQNVPIPLKTSHTSANTTPNSYVVGLSIKLSSTSSFVPPVVLGLQASLLQYLTGASSKFSSEKDTFRFYTSLYRYLGEEAQPDQHPVIACRASADWLITVLVVDENESRTLKREDMNKWMEEWEQGIDDEKAMMSWGLWDGDMLFG